MSSDQTAATTPAHPDAPRARGAAEHAVPGEGHAIVLGAGIAGLLATRVLADRFARVTLVERDELTETDGGGPDVRRGVPQARHLHGLLDRGRTAIEQLYPGFTAEMARRGAATAEVLIGTRWYVAGLRVATADTGLTSVLATRPLLEAVLRDRTLALPGVRPLPGTTARGLLGAAHRVRGVLAVTDDETRTLPADLVVDATGRGSRAGEWLTRLGAHAPQEERLEVDLGYSSRFFRCAPGDADGPASIIMSTGANGHGGGAIRVEGDRWHVTLAGMLGDHPPTDPAEFAAFAAGLSGPDIHDIVTGREPLGDPVPHRFRQSVRRRFDRQPIVPRGFLVLGDALCSFNPLYAQGMTVAAQQALALRDCLHVPEHELPQRFYAAAGAAVTAAWQLATSADLAHDGLVARRTLRTRVTNAYVARAQRAAHLDPRVARAFLRVTNLVESPAALLDPRIAGRILLHGNVSPTAPASEPGNH
ncbi:NAD(P)/FAD-dependent oxidoreductase [Nocardia macrotermitis]|uniref:Putative epoxidase LasC n=1 Tax=Nocardia macrotermitis TaxID=2585198 RepID=A0A7K0CVX1_9NOCA|nr:FAD-dependent oxidoreductase [Nocardia macrotermitis]MQY17132.1 putative epoxidase LasC [Nocardia macrotermitis]